MGEGVAEEGETPEDNPGADHRGARDGEHGGEERLAHERVIDERVDPPADGVGQPGHLSTRVNLAMMLTLGP